MTGGPCSDKPVAAGRTPGSWIPGTQKFALVVAAVNIVIQSPACEDHDLDAPVRGHDGPEAELQIYVAVAQAWQTMAGNAHSHSPRGRPHDYPAGEGSLQCALSQERFGGGGILMRTLLVLTMVTACASYPASAQDVAQTADITGTWLGTLNAGAVKLRIAFHITANDKGYSATMDSLDQGAKGLPVASLTREGAKLIMTMPMLGAKYEGTIAEDAASIHGTFHQGGALLPLTLGRLKDGAPLETPRPQEPKSPFPYRSEDVTYENKTAGIILAGTLTIPQGKGPFPAALLITGSGPQDRNEEIMGHKPFLVLSDYLTRHGIVVLRVDDRGIGKSGGQFATATTADFATGAASGVAYLGTRAEVDLHKIGLIGHSEGGIIAAMVAAGHPTIAFIVMMAGTGVPGAVILVEQVRMLARASGQTKEKADEAARNERKILGLVKEGKDTATIEKEISGLSEGKIPEGEMAAQVQALTSRWFRYFLAYDPASSLKRVKCPVLALDGSKDLQVSPEQNLTAIRTALEEGGNKNVETDELLGLNHLFQTAPTGLPNEYGQIEETIAPSVLQKVSNWVLKEVEPKR